MDISKIEKFLTTYDLIQNSYAHDLKKKKKLKELFILPLLFLYNLFLTFGENNHTFFLS